MKTSVSLILGFFLFSSVSFAAVRDPQVDLELEAMALVQVIQLQTEADAGARSGLGDFLKNLVQGIEDLKQQLLDQFDANGNGRIDPGAELDAFKETIQSVVLLLADSNQNGRIDLEDVRVLSQFLVTQVQEKAKEQFCPAIVKQGEAAGWWIRFRPVLNNLYQACTRA